MILATALISGGLVAATATPSGAAPVNVTVATSCGARDNDAPTKDALGLAKGLLGSDKIGINLQISAADIPETAGLDQEINAAFAWKATMDQNLIDKAAGLINSIEVKNMSGTMDVKGPSSVPTFSGTAADRVVTPVAGQAAVLDLGTFGGPITTTAGGIITYRVGTLRFDAKLAIPSAGLSFDLKLQCAVSGSNLIAKTSVKDPDAPVFNPEVIALEAEANGTASVDLLGDIITPGKTPLLPESLKIVEPPSAGQASITNGVFNYTAPATGGTYSTTVEVCGAPKAEGGTPGVNENVELALGGNWTAQGQGLLNPRPVAFSLKVGDEETPLIWSAEHILAPLFSLPIGGTTPTAENWAPEKSAGLVNQYALETKYKRPTAGDITAALEAVPSIGAGNVEVTDLKENEASPEKVTGYSVQFIGEKAEQDVPDISLGQWYSVPPQEILDRISAAIAGVAGSIGGEPAEPTPLDGMTGAQADKYIGDKILASFTGGPAVTDAEWEAWLKIKILDPIIAAVPAISAFLNSLFPEKLGTEILEQGEEGTPPQPLCAQAIIDVTVTEVLVETTLPPGGNNTGGTPNGPQVGGTSDTRGGSAIGFVG